MADTVSHYDVLRVARDASDDAIRRSYRRLALYWHPVSCVCVFSYVSPSSLQETGQLLDR